MGRDKTHASELTGDIRSKAVSTVRSVNRLLSLFAADTGIQTLEVASGWRPAGVNSATSNAAATSRHITAQAVDIRDTPNRDLARWVATHQHEVEEAGLYCERFEWTPTWVHFSPCPPKSGHRFYIPSSAPALCARLPEQTENC
jgi:NAD-specific glutamate dehydrogenase